MPRHSSRRVGSRALALIAVAIGTQLGAGGIAAATAQDAAPATAPGEPTVTEQLAATDAATTPDRTAAVASAAPAAPAVPPAANAVTVSRAKASSTRTVSIIDFAYDPTALSLKVGDTVQWINNGVAEEGHNVIGDGLASPVLQTSESYSFTFTAAGTYDYICSLHPKMKASVEVIDPNADEATPTKKKGGSRRGNSSAGASAGGGDSSGSSGASGYATGTGSESAAGRSADAAGTSGSLPSTGWRPLGLALAGLGLLALGLALRAEEARRDLLRDLAFSRLQPRG